MENLGMEKGVASNGSVSKTDTALSILEVSPSHATDASQQVADNGMTHRDRQEQLRRPAWVRFRSYMRDPFAEFMGVFTLIVFGDGVVAQVVLSKGTRGDYQSINWG
jgi:aquaglyceroporin related protein, other eukaryote